MSTPPQYSDPPVGPLETVVPNIQVGIVEPDKENNVFTDSKDGIWQDYEIRSRFESDKHRYMMGITSPDGFQGDSAAFVQLAAPTLVWIVDWTASKMGSKPSIPDTDMKEKEWVFLDEHIEPGMIIVGPDGTTPLYRISGTYFYGARKPSANVVNNTKFSRPPFIDNSFSRTIPESMFVKNLIV